MSTCFSCNNKIKPGEEQCLCCGQKFHHTHYAIFKSAKKSVSDMEISLARRFCAGAIDFAYAAGAIGIALFFLDQPLAETTLKQFIIQCWYVPTLFGLLQVFLLAHDGQSVGKKLMKIAIVVHKTNEHPSPFKVVVIRTLLPIVTFALPVLGLILYLVNLAWVFRADRRCLHDYLAGTEVVHE